MKMLKRHIGLIASLYFFISCSNLVVEIPELKEELPLEESAVSEMLMETSRNLIVPESTIGSLELPTQGDNGEQITWTSDNPAIISEDGTVNRPPYGSGDVIVTITAEIEIDGESMTVDFSIIVPEMPPVEIGLSSVDDLTSITENMTLPQTTDSGAAITWSSDNPAVVDENGTVTRPAFGSGDATVTLTSEYEENGVTATEDIVVIVKQEDPTDAEAVTYVTDNMNLTDLNDVLSLPSEGDYDTNISWSSDNIAVIDENGNVTRPSYGSGDATVTITVEVEKNGTTSTENIVIIVPELPTDEIVFSGADTASSITTDITLPDNINGNNVTAWISGNPALIDETGSVTRPAFGSGDATVTVTAQYEKDGATIEEDFVLVVKEQEPTDQEAVDAVMRSYTLNDLNDVLNLPSTGDYGTDISWASSNTAVIDENGNVTRPAFGNGDATVTITVTVEKNGTTATEDVIIIVPELEQMDAQAVAEDLNAIDLTQAGSIDLNNITGDLSLPTNGASGTTISWDTNSSPYMDNSGKVTRPANSDGNKTVTITATVEKNGVTDTKDFIIIVIAEEAVATVIAGKYYDTIDGSNRTVHFVTDSIYRYYINGVEQWQGFESNYTFTGTEILFITGPLSPKIQDFTNNSFSLFGYLYYER